MITVMIMCVYKPVKTSLSVPVYIWMRQEDYTSLFGCVRRWVRLGHVAAQELSKGVCAASCFEELGHCGLRGRIYM